MAVPASTMEEDPANLGPLPPPWSAQGIPRSPSLGDLSSNQSGLVKQKELHRIWTVGPPRRSTSIPQRGGSKDPSCLGTPTRWTACGLRSRNSEALPKLASISRRSSLPSLRAGAQQEITGNAGGNTEPHEAAASNAGHFSKSLGRMEEISQLLCKLEELKPPTWPCHASTADQDTPEEVKDWISSTLASIPSKRKSTPHLLPALEGGAAPRVSLKVAAGEERVPDSRRAASKASEGEESPHPSKDRTVEPRRSSVKASVGGANRRAGASLENAVPESGGNAEAEARVRKPSLSLPDASQSLERLRGGIEGFSESELSRMQATFNRLKEPNGNDVLKENLQPILHQLGYSEINGINEEKIRELADQVSVYSTLDFNDFVAFAKKVSEYERSLFKAVFDKFDEDNSGQLSTDELQKFMTSIGFTPLRATVKEALSLVDVDNTGTLSFIELVHLITIYRQTQGFTGSELADLKRTFSGFQERMGGFSQIPAHRLQEMLVSFYGPLARSTAKALETEVLSTKAKAVIEIESAQVDGIQLPEAILWARRVREEEFKVYRAVFDMSDEDNSGSIGIGSLQEAFRELGYTVTQSTVNEVIAESEQDWGGGIKDGKVDFDEFVNFVLNLCKRDGFSKSEIAELQSTFDRFDDNHNKKVDAMELASMLRYMGYPANLEDVQCLISKADFDGSGNLDFNEYLRLMRVHREDQLLVVKETFSGHLNEKLGGMPMNAVTPALANLGYEGVTHEMRLQLLVKATKSQNGAVDLEKKAVFTLADFIVIIDEARATRVKHLRQCAGFTEREIEHFQKLFASYDSDGNGVIDPGELGPLLNDLGLPMSTVEDRGRVMAELDRAREAAAAVGVENVGEMGGGPLEFWVLVQLLRVLCNRDDKRVLDREAQAVEQTRFFVSEVDQFRDVFHSWFERDKVFEGGDDQIFPGVASCLGAGEVKELSKDCMRRLLRSLGVTLNAEQRTTLEKKIDQSSPSGRVDFADFLRLMRWMLETNFANIQGSAAKAAASG